MSLFCLSHNLVQGIFIHGTDMADRGLIVLFFGLFLLFFGLFSLAPPGIGLIVLFFGLFLVFFDIFSDAPYPLEIFLPTPLTLFIHYTSVLALTDARTYVK